MHLKQPLMDASIHASGDEGLNLQAFARPGMSIVSTAIVGRDATSVPERWRKQVLHGVLRSRENVVPEELPLGQGFVELSHQELGCVRREGGDKARKGFVRRTRP